MKNITKKEFDNIANEFKGKLETIKKLLISNGFIKIENDNIYITESGNKLVHLIYEKRG